MPSPADSGAAHRVVGPIGNRVQQSTNIVNRAARRSSSGRPIGNVAPLFLLECASAEESSVAESGTDAGNLKAP